MEAKGIGTNYATLTLDHYEQTIIHEALTQLADRVGETHAADKTHVKAIRHMAEQIREVRLL